MILLTGGAGYIGSHVAVELLLSGHEVAIYDNFSRSSITVIHAIERITGKKPRVFDGDVRSLRQLTKVMQDVQPTAVVHLAGAKNIAESMLDPLKYFDHNCHGTSQLIAAMTMTNVKVLLFSSSASVYSSVNSMPLRETATITPISPYATSKLIGEHVVEQCAHSYKMASGALRYFNPSGAHPSGILGDNPVYEPTSLFSRMSHCAITGEALQVFGTNYDTVDGSAVRDFIHVSDLAQAHVEALKVLQDEALIGGSHFWAANIGTGKGTTVLQAVKAFEETNSIDLRLKIEDRRPGDIAVAYADTSKFWAMTQWKPKYTIEDMCSTQWKWHEHTLTNSTAVL